MGFDRQFTEPVTEHMTAQWDLLIKYKYSDLNRLCVWLLFKKKNHVLTSYSCIFSSTLCFFHCYFEVSCLAVVANQGNFVLIAPKLYRFHRSQCNHGVAPKVLAFARVYVTALSFFVTLTREGTLRTRMSTLTVICLSVNIKSTFSLSPMLPFFFSFFLFRAIEPSSAAG